MGNKSCLAKSLANPIKTTTIKKKIALYVQQLRVVSLAVIFAPCHQTLFCKHAKILFFPLHEFSFCKQILPRRRDEGQIYRTSPRQILLLGMPRPSLRPLFQTIALTAGCCLHHLWCCKSM